MSFVNRQCFLKNQNKNNLQCIRKIIKSNMFTRFLVLAACVLCISTASPKKYMSEDGGFQPSNLRYYESQIHNSTEKEGRKESKESSSDRVQRFGTLGNFGHSGGGGGVQYGNTGTGLSYGMTPMKIDIGGIALGALIGLGAILIVPKLAHVFSTGGYGYRSLDGDLSMSDLLSKVDRSLEEHNIDSSSCMQRIICSYVHQSQKSIHDGQAGTVEQLVYALSNNSLFTYMLDGSSVKQAIDMGKQADLEKCAALYTKCPVSKENVMQIIGSLLPA